MNGRGLGTNGRPGVGSLRDTALRTELVWRSRVYGQGLRACSQLLCRCLSPADPSQTTALAASEEVETDAAVLAVLAAGETAKVGAYFRDV